MMGSVGISVSMHLESMFHQWFKTTGLALLALFSAGAALAAPVPAGAYITDLAVEPGNPDGLYMATSGAGVFYRPDMDSAWEAVPGGHGEGRRYALAMTLDASPVLLSGGEETGLVPATGGEKVTVLDIVPHPENDGLVFILAPEGVWRVEDPFAREGKGEWTLIFDYSEWLERHRKADWPETDWTFTRFQKLTIDPHRPDTLLLGARWEGGYHRSDDGGRTWTHHWLSGIFRRADELRVDPFHPEIYYAFTHHQGLLKSWNRGQSWIVTGKGLEPQRRTPYYGVYLLGGISFDPNTPGRILSGSDYATWMSEDFGDTWSEVGRTLTCEFVRATAFHSRNPDILFAGSNVGFFQSFDGGKTWIPANEGLPERKVLQNFEAVIDGQPYAFARVAGGNPVYRRPLGKEPEAPWRNMSWMINTGASGLRWEERTETLVLTTTDGGELRSRDGGFRWSVPEVAYIGLEVLYEAGEQPPEAGPGDLVIQNAVVPDPEPLLHWYKRPPFISIQLVGTGYPEDGSTPLWQTNWESRLSGPLAIPEGLNTRGTRLYVEVRDFQGGTRAGSAPFSGKEAVTAVVVQPVH